MEGYPDHVRACGGGRVNAGRDLRNHGVRGESISSPAGAVAALLTTSPERRSMTEAPRALIA
jgi:hypothetical protein